MLLSQRSPVQGSGTAVNPAVNFYSQPIFLEYNVQKYGEADPLYIYSANTGALNNFGTTIIATPTVGSPAIAHTQDVSTSNWFTVHSVSSNKNFFIMSNNSSALYTYNYTGTALLDAFYRFHFAAESRLGIV